VDLVAWGLKAGADHTAATAMGKTPLHLAAEANKPAAVIALLKGGANPNAKTLAGFTPLHLSALSRHRLTVRTLLVNSITPVDVDSDSVHGTPHDLAKDPAIREMLEEYSMHGFLKSAMESGSAVVPTPKSKRVLRQPSLTLESLESGIAAVPTPKSQRILLHPSLTLESLETPKSQRILLQRTLSSSDRHQLKAIERANSMSLSRA